MNQLIFDFARSDYPGFDKFLGTANRELIYVLQQAQDQFVYVWGQRGSGKSHLLKAWAAQAREQGHHAVYLLIRLLGIEKWVFSDGLDGVLFVVFALEAHAFAHRAAGNERP
ncbi:MAG: hypothetical protein ACFNKE_01445 [Neisseria elongata]